MNADQLLTRMLSFANSSECPLIDKPRVINAAYKTWVDSSNEANPFKYNLVKAEKCTIKNVFIIGTSILEKKINNYTLRKMNRQFSDRNKKKVICLETNKTFNSVKETAEHFGISKISLAAKLNGTRVNNTQLMYLSDYEKNKIE